MPVDPAAAVVAAVAAVGGRGCAGAHSSRKAAVETQEGYSDAGAGCLG